MQAVRSYRDGVLADIALKGTGTVLSLSKVNTVRTSECEFDEFTLKSVPFARYDDDLELSYFLCSSKRRDTRSGMFLVRGKEPTAGDIEKRAVNTRRIGTTSDHPSALLEWTSTWVPTDSTSPYYGKGQKCVGERRPQRCDRMNVTRRPRGKAEAVCQCRCHRSIEPEEQNVDQRA
jgi:hypothetical protein